MKRIGLLILTLFFLIAVSGAYAYLMYEINAAVFEIAVAKGSVESIGQRDAATKAAERFLADTKTETEVLDGYVIRGADVVGPIEAIEETARRERADVTISSANTVEVPDWQHHELVRVAFSADGSYASLARLASALETLPFASTLERVTLEATADKWFATYSILFVKEKTP